jgi:hypothetical protein
LAIVFLRTRGDLPSAQPVNQSSIHTGYDAAAKDPPGKHSRDFAVVLVQTSNPVGRFGILSTTSMK